MLTVSATDEPSPGLPWHPHEPVIPTGFRTEPTTVARLPMLTNIEEYGSKDLSQPIVSALGAALWADSLLNASSEELIAVGASDVPFSASSPLTEFASSVCPGPLIGNDSSTGLALTKAALHSASQRL
ncbi:hypothetical protein FIE12Z_1530 [Fusarium flagelliforme]|uniref:Uncharacterized protein n=1 Tax=Fusarium flagelliforme TaxID=2675880 RepID=A0A395N3L8_9HYPO|nr:hypothetical protein FIE12Z_1530 [Fusarium flagelliforme]